MKLNETGRAVEAGGFEIERCLGVVVVAACLFGAGGDAAKLAVKERDDAGLAITCSGPSRAPIGTNRNSATSSSQNLGLLLKCDFLSNTNTPRP